nr:unnamed protein product [Callosobruchus analis]
MVLSMDRWIGKVAVVTGASAGIGEAIAERLVERGMKVVGVARRKERLDELAKRIFGKKGNFYPMQGDVSKEEDILKVFTWTRENLGPLHVLVNNAGIVCKSGIQNGRTEDWLQTINVNVVGLCMATREALKDMTEHNVDGHIFNINSVVGHYTTGHPRLDIYTASKHAVTALTESMRKQMATQKLKIRFTSVSPGMVDTEIIASAQNNLSVAHIFKDAPMLKPEDIADAVEYVLSTPPHVQVVGVARRKERLDELAKRTSGKKGKFYPMQGDVSKEEDILKVFTWTRENLGPLHVLVNNAGIVCRSGIQNGKTEDWLQTINVNVVGLCMATREALKDMTEHKVDGHIFNINSVLGHCIIGNHPRLDIYTASKHAVTVLTESMRKQMATQKLKIRFTSISPGMVDTEIIENARVAPIFKDAPMLKAEDIADAVEYALSTPPHVQVVGVARRKDRLDALAQRTTGKKGKFYPFQGDVSKEEDVLNVFKWTRDNLGPVHVLINNAGVGCHCNIANGRTEDWLKTFKVNRGT